MRNYPRMTVEDFGTHLLDSNDLDPVYVALVEMQKDPSFLRSQLERWLVAYWCFYHVGVASYMSELDGREFWETMSTAAKNVEPAPDGGRWPRAKERRHFRGASSELAVALLAKRYGHDPGGMVRYCAEATSCSEVMKRSSEHRLFGPWIGFKVADMLERVLGESIDFDQSSVFMFKDPVEAALMVWRKKSGQLPKAQPREKQRVIDDVVDYLKDYFKNRLAPPRMDRPIDLQEVETILCCWKSHTNGHYPMFNDIDDIREGTPPWAEHCPTAELFLQCMPEGSPSNAND